MNHAQRKLYHTTYWPRACAAQGWDPRDTARRQSVTAYVTGHTSTTQLQQYQVTALFVFLDFLAYPEDFDKSAAWSACKSDPITYNKTRQAKYWERQAGYTPSGRLRQHRFRHKIPDSDLSTPLTPAQADQFLLTARSRAKKKQNLAHTTTELAGIDCPF